MKRMNRWLDWLKNRWTDCATAARHAVELLQELASPLLGLFDPFLGAWKAVEILAGWLWRMLAPVAAFVTGISAVWLAALCMVALYRPLLLDLLPIADGGYAFWIAQMVQTGVAGAMIVGIVLTFRTFKHPALGTGCLSGSVLFLHKLWDSSAFRDIKAGNTEKILELSCITFLTIVIFLCSFARLYTLYRSRRGQPA